MLFRKFFDCIKTGIQRNDLYGKQVKLTYNGEESYNTTFGGILSLSIKLILFAYAWILIGVVINRNDTK